jgi:DNA-binding NarL/FixJ family response regulator
MDGFNLKNLDILPHLVYYSNNPDSHKCTAEASKMFKMTWSCPITWQALMEELERGCEFLAFHSDIIPKSHLATPIEFVEAITTVSKFIPACNNLKIGVVIKPTTPLQTVKSFQKSGVQGILLDMNHYPQEEARSSADAFINGIPYWPKHVMEKLPKKEKKKSLSSEIILTPRQSQILRLIKERGASNKTIAKALGISESTVKLHVTQIFKKYGVRNRTQLAVFSSA